MSCKAGVKSGTNPATLAARVYFHVFAPHPFPHPFVHCSVVLIRFVSLGARGRLDTREPRLENRGGSVTLSHAGGQNELLTWQAEIRK